MVVEKVLTSDYFALFGLEPRFSVDLSLLGSRYLALQAQVHPDRFAQADAAERRISMQCAARVNEAYQTLKTPLARAGYVLQLAGKTVEENRGAALLPSDFLMAQMEWRESLEEARSAADCLALENLNTQLEKEMVSRYSALGGFLDAQDWEKAREGLDCLMFLEKLRLGLEDALAELDE